MRGLITHHVKNDLFIDHVIKWLPTHINNKKPKLKFESISNNERIIIIFDVNKLFGIWVSITDHVTKPRNQI